MLMLASVIATNIGRTCSPESAQILNAVQDYNGDTPDWWPRDIPFGPLAKNRARAAQVYTAGLKQLKSLQD